MQPSIIYNVFVRDFRKQKKRITILMADDDPEDSMLTRDAWEEARLANDLRFVGDGEELMDYLHRRGDYADPRLFLRGQFMAPRRLATTAKAYALGIPIVAGVDTSYGADSFARVSREVGLLVEAGLSNRDAWAAATTRAAQMLELHERIGRVAPGYEADLLVVDRNPLEDPGALQDVLLVVSNGVQVSNRLGILSLTR